MKLPFSLPLPGGEPAIMRVELRPAPFDALAEVKDYQALPDSPGKAGATCVFIGTMRDSNEGEEIPADDPGTLSGHDRKNT